MCIRKTSKSSELLAKIEEVFLQQNHPMAVRHATEPVVTANTGATAIPPAFDGVLDLDVMMDNAGGDQQLMDDLVSTMIEETPRLMSQIDAAVAQLDASAMQRAAHSLMGSLAILGSRRHERSRQSGVRWTSWNAGQR